MSDLTESICRRFTFVLSPLIFYIRPDDDPVGPKHVAYSYIRNILQCNGDLLIN